MRKILLSGLFVFSICSHANSNPNELFHHKAYVGALGGFGSTTWEGLVPSKENQNIAMSLSTPVSVEEGGGVWGFLAGYEFSRHFAVEGGYTRYPAASVVFDEDSLFAFENDGRTDFVTNTETLSFMVKVMLDIPKTDLRFFSSAGGAAVNRWDEFVEQWRIAPTFGLGFNTNFTQRLMGEFGFNYTAGYGESEINPSKDYIPFLYSVSVRFAYRFA